MSGTGPYDTAWRDLRFRIALFWLIWVLYLPVGMFALFGLDALSPGFGHAHAIAIFVGLGALWAASAFYRVTFRCPRCEGSYFSSDGWTNMFGRTCLHCGLPRYANDPPHS